MKLYKLNPINLCHRGIPPSKGPGQNSLGETSTSGSSEMIMFCGDRCRVSPFPVMVAAGTTEDLSKLHFRVNDVPKWPSIFLFGFQQTMLCLSGLLVVPFLTADVACAGSATMKLRVQLIAATFVTSGLATIVQSTFGLRLSILHGPSFAFLPPLLAFKALPENRCSADEYTSVPQEEWMARMGTIQGSLLLGVLPMIFIGATGLVGVFAKFVGPITIAPLITLLTLGTVPTLEQKMSAHWISILEFLILIVLVVFLEEVRVPLPYYSLSRKQLRWTKCRIFGQFPYLIGIFIGWSVCLILTVTDAEPEEGQARVDKNASMAVLKNAPWFQIPLPGGYDAFHINAGLLLGYAASTMACTMESIGDYAMCARISEERHPPVSNTNRAIVCEGFGAILGAVYGIGTGLTTYAECIALMSVTRVCSRVTMQMAGILLLLLGLFTKCAAILATIPEAIIGGILAMGMTMISGVALSNLHSVDLRLSRNLSIMGLAVLCGMTIPTHFELHPMRTGNKTADDILNMLLCIKMLVGGLIAFVLDNVVGGATKEQRGFPPAETNKTFCLRDGYSLPEWAEAFLRRVPLLQRLPFLPSFPNPPDSPSLS